MFARSANQFHHRDTENTEIVERLELSVLSVSLW
jgi:hypothetical protein